MSLDGAGFKRSNRKLVTHQQPHIVQVGLNFSGHHGFNRVCNAISILKTIALFEITKTIDPVLTMRLMQSLRNQ
jgi:hypothetical protein